MLDATIESEAVNRDRTPSVKMRRHGDPRASGSLAGVPAAGTPTAAAIGGSKTAGQEREGARPPGSRSSTPRSATSG